VVRDASTRIPAACGHGEALPREGEIMSAEIHSWIDGHLAVRKRAYETRGATELFTGLRWPRTTGADVMSIAALFDDAVEMFGTPGIRLRWRAARADLQRER
jgi:hypothetical protein